MKPLPTVFASLHLIAAIVVFSIAAADPEKKAWTLILALADFPCSLILGLLCSWSGWLRHLMEDSLLLQAIYFTVFGSIWFYSIGYLLQSVPRGIWTKLLSAKTDGF